eukprot:scaffold5986_cov128-Isochrysis_galbana.AAC.9
MEARLAWAAGDAFAAAPRESWRPRGWGWPGSEATHGVWRSRLWTWLPPSPTRIPPTTPPGAALKLENALAMCYYCRDVLLLQRLG